MVRRIWDLVGDLPVAGALFFAAPAAFFAAMIDS
jgi:hypothetical protein